MQVNYTYPTNNTRTRTFQKMNHHKVDYREKNAENGPHEAHSLYLSPTSLTAVSSGIEDAHSFDYSSSGSACSSSIEGSNDGKVAMIELAKERDTAREEAQETKDTLCGVMEVIQILTRQIKMISNAEFTQMRVERVDSFVLPSDLSIDGENDPGDDLGFHFDMIDLNNNVAGHVEIENDPALSIARPETQDCNRKRTFSGVSACSIATYTNDDNQRCSELLHQSFNSLQPEFSKIGADLIALNGACRTIEQNARLISEESTTMLQDLRQAHSELNELDDRCTKAENCAKQLYKDNKNLKKELEKNRAERKFLKREIKTLMDEKKARERFQQELLDSLKAHENIMIERALSAKESVAEDSHDAMDGDVVSKGENPNGDAPNNSSDESKNVSTDQNAARLNPFGKFFSSFSGTSAREKEEIVDDTSDTDVVLTTPVTPCGWNSTPSTSVSPTLATMLEAPDFNDDTPGANSAVLQLTPTTSTSESMKSVLSAQDLNPNDTNENGLKPFSKDGISWKQRTVNSSPSSVSTKRSVVTVKMPTRYKKIDHTRTSNTSVATNITKTTKKHFRHYTIGAK